MSRNNTDRRIEALEAELTQQRRLVRDLFAQISKLRDELAEQEEKPHRGRKRRKEL